MHERSLILNLIQKVTAIATQQNAVKVIGITVRLGALSHMSAQHFREHFDVEAKGTVADGARLTASVSADVNDPHAQEILLESVEIEEL